MVAYGIYQAVDQVMDYVGGDLDYYWDEATDYAGDVWNDVWSEDSCCEAPAPLPPPTLKAPSFTGPKANVNGSSAYVMQQLSRRDFTRPDYFSGIKAAVGAVYNHYTSNEKSSTLENAGYDCGSIIFKPLALGSLINTANDRWNGNISDSRLSWNLSTTLTGAYKFYPASIGSCYVDLYDYSNERGWLGTINEQFTKGMQSLSPSF